MAEKLFFVNIDAKDNLAIGNGASAATYPARLYIKGKGTTTDLSFLIHDSGGDESVRVTDDGAIFSNGRGRTTSTTAFGDSLSPDLTGTSNSIFGYGIMPLATSATENSIFGYLSGAAITTGSDNTLLGRGVGSVLNTGSSNIGIGHGSLGTTTTALNNIAIGVAADAGTTGGQNIVMGNLAGQSLTTGTFNFFVGYRAGGMQADGTASNNVAIGTDAFLKGGDDSNVHIGTYAGYNKLGFYNVGIGESACSGDTVAGTSTGSHNIALGYRAFYLPTTAHSSVAIGSLALTAATTGFYNVAIGYESANNVTTARDGVYIGRRAGAATTTQSYNVHIGNYAGQYETGGSTFYLDTYTRTNEANARITSLMYGIFDGAANNQRLTVNATMGIGTPAAANTRIHIQGTGITEDTATFLAENSTNLELIKAQDDGLIKISSGVLQVNGSGPVNSAANVEITPANLLTGNYGLHVNNTIALGGTNSMGGVAIGVTGVNSYNTGLNLDVRNGTTGNDAIYINRGNIWMRGKEDIIAVGASSGYSNLSGMVSAVTQTGSAESNAFHAQLWGTAVAQTGMIVSTGNDAAGGTLTNTGFNTSLGGASASNIGFRSNTIVYTNAQAQYGLYNTIASSNGSTFTGTYRSAYLDIKPAAQTGTTYTTITGMEVRGDTGHSTQTITNMTGGIIDLDNSNTGTVTDMLGLHIKVSGTVVGTQFALKIEDGTEGAGKVLTSDANGNATWEAPSGFTGTGAYTNFTIVDGIITAAS